MLDGTIWLYKVGSVTHEPATNTIELGSLYPGPRITIHLNFTSDDTGIEVLDELIEALVAMRNTAVADGR